MTDQEKLTYIETERAKLQKRLTKKCGFNVDLQASVHVTANVDTRPLIRAGMQLKWPFGRSKTLGWIDSQKEYAHTTIFFKHEVKGTQS